MKKIYILFVLMAFGASTSAQMARVQVIHNSPDSAAKVVDIYLDNTLLINDFQFRSASPFMDAPAGSQVTIGIAPGNSSSADDTVFSYPVILDATKTYVVVANGLISTNGYNPVKPFVLSIFDMGRETATQPTNTDILVVHGSTDAPMIDVVERTEGVLVDDLSYGESSPGYLELPTANYTIDIKPGGGGDPVASFLAPLQTLNLGGVATVVVASGFLNPANNSNGPAFGLFAAPTIGGQLVELPAAPSSIEKFQQDKINVWPNPATGRLHFILDQEISNAAFEISNMSGKVVSSSGQDKLQGNVKHSIDISNLSSGIYVLTIKTEAGLINKKISKF